MKKLTTRNACDLAKAFEGVTKKDHFGSDAFIANGRIFATIWHDKNEVNLMLDQERQKSILVRDDSFGFHLILNGWGKNAITVRLSEVDPTVFKSALHMAWLHSANKRTAMTKKGAVKKQKHNLKRK